MFWTIVGAILFVIFLPYIIIILGYLAFFVGIVVHTIGQGFFNWFRSKDFVGSFRRILLLLKVIASFLIAIMVFFLVIKVFQVIAISIFEDSYPTIAAVLILSSFAIAWFVARKTYKALCGFSRTV